MCATCTSLSVCQSCQVINGIAYYLEGSSCTVNCPSNKYGNVNTLTCDICANGCLTCFGPTTSECNSCTNYNAVDYFLEYNTNLCSQNCPGGQYKDTTSYRCLLCSPLCVTCSGSATNCLTCGMSVFHAHLYFYSNQCLITCPSSFWGNSVNHLCEACNPACLECFSSSIDSCTSCTNISTTIYYKFRERTTCGTVCPDG